MEQTLSKASARSDKLVSIICRTTNRNELSTALSSVAKQTYRPLEIVLIDVRGSNQVDYKDCLGDIPATVVSNGRHLSRSDAANAGIDNASGHYLMFLDDDDWISPEHIANLIELLSSDSQTRAAYSSTQKTDLKGNNTDTSFRIPYDPIRLMHDNYLPIHSVLFEKSLTNEGCRFDPDLDIFEDWDFWLQVAQHTPFKHLDKLTAYYRDGGDSETALPDPELRFQSGNAAADARAKLFNKWLPTWSGEKLNTMLGSLDMQSDLHVLDEKLIRLNDDLVSRNHQLSELNEQLEDNALQLERKKIDLEHVHNDLANLAAKHDQAMHKKAQQIKELEFALDDVLNSTSWKLTQPYRWLGSRTSQYLLSPMKSGMHSSAEKVLKNFPGLNQKFSARFSERSLHKGREDLSSTINYALDSDPAICLKTMHLKGWAVSLDPVITVSVSIDGLQHLTLSPCLYRQDIGESYPDIPHAMNSGFDESFSLNHLENGAHELLVEFRTSSGCQELYRCTFYLFSESELYNAWLQLSQSVEVGSRKAEAVKIKAPKSSIVHILICSGNESIGLPATIASVLSQTHESRKIHCVGFSRETLTKSNEAVDLTLPDDSYEHGDIREALAKLKDMGGHFVGIVAGEILAPNALEEYVEMVRASDAKLVYSDHDLISATGDHHSPTFTFSWSPEHLYSRNYIGGIYLASTDLISSHPSLDSSDSWRYSFLLTISNTDESVLRVPKVLWSMMGSAIQPANVVEQEECRALQEYFSQQGINAEVTQSGSARNVSWTLQSCPKVSIIVPTMGNLSLIKPCFESLVSLTTYDNYEVIVLDNSRGKNPDGIEYLRSQEFKVIKCDEDFNWARLNNIGAGQADGELLLFLNDDIEIIEDRWLEELVKQTARKDIGAVGGLLLYPQGAIQHAGVFLVNYGGGCAHLFHKMLPGPEIYLRLDEVTREVSANTGACLMVCKEKFSELNGFDEELAVVGNDIDFCLRLIDRGYRNIWTPACRLIHHESISREASVPRDDEKGMWKRWKHKFEAGDAYYNPNLSLRDVDCSLNLTNIVEPLKAQFCTKKNITAHTGKSPLRNGINLIAYIRAEMGLGEAARSDARALTAAAIDFGIINFQTGNPASMTDLSWQHKEFFNPVYNTNLIHINADHMSFVMSELPRYFFENRYNIGYWAWELAEIPDEWISAFDHLDEIWAPSNFVRDAIAARSPVPVICMPHCVAPRTDGNPSRAQFKLPEHPFLFLSMFDTRSMTQRKNPFGAIEAFCHAFDSDDDSVCLVVKMNNPDEKDLMTIRDQTGGRKNIFLLDQTLKKPEIDTLLNVIDCYVSLHRSEGFGLPPAEAMSLGKPVILTNWSGSTDYMTPDNCMPIDYSLIELEEDIGPYKAGQVWAEPDLDQAAKAMRRLASEPDLVKTIGDNARQTIRSQFSPAAVGKLMRDRLEQIKSSRSPD